MLAAGLVFTAICGAGAGIGIWALADRRTRPGGQDTGDAVAAVTALLSPPWASPPRAPRG